MENLLKEIIEDIILNDQISTKEKLIRTTSIVNECHQKFLESVDNLDLVDIAIPGKWSKADQFIGGMSLYNFIMEKEIFSMGSAGRHIYCIFKNRKVFQESKLDMNKIKGIVIPQIYDKLLLSKKLDQFQIQIDKETQWNTIFSTTVGRIVDLIKSIK